MSFLLPLAVVSLSAGCTTFTDDNAAARVNDIEIDHDDLADLAEFVAVANNQLPSGTDATQARNAASIWVQTTALQEFFEDEGVEVPEDLVVAAAEQLNGLPEFGELNPSAQTLLVDFISILQYLPSIDADGSLLATAADAADIYIDPRIGSFTSDAGVIPLG